MLTYRQKKRLAYAIAFGGLIFLLISLLVWRAARQAGPAVVTPSPVAYEPVVVEHVQAITHAAGIDVVARLRNPNLRAGVGSTMIDFILRNQAGEIIHQRTQRTYIVPNGVQYVAGLNLPAVDPASVEVVLPAVLAFTEVPEAVTMPAFSVFLRERTNRVVGTQAVQEQKGVVRNIGSLDWQRVEVTGVALNAEGHILAAGQTFVGELAAGEQREFTLQWPVPAGEPAQVIAVANTNIYSEENVVKIIGDPSLLR